MELEDSENNKSTSSNGRKVRRMRWSTGVLALAVVGLTCSAALAGDIKCHVTMGGTDVAAAKLVLAPGGAAVMTNAAGLGVFNGLTAGTYLVTAEKSIGGTLHGALKDSIAVAATGGVTVNLSMTRAIHISQYLPLGVGSVWQYTETTSTSTATTSRTRRERAVGTDTVAGDTVTVLEVTWGGSPDVMKMYNRSSSEGYGIYREARAGDTLDYVPPMKFPNLVPLGGVVHLASTIKHSSGAPDEHVTMECRLVAFDTVTVPAGTFAHCPRIQCEVKTNGTSTRIILWLAKGVGQVRVTERKPDKRVRRSLEEYNIRPLLLTPLRKPGRLIPAP